MEQFSQRTWQIVYPICLSGGGRRSVPMQKKLFQNERRFKSERDKEERTLLARHSREICFVPRIEARFHLVPVRRAEGVRPCRIAEKGLPAAWLTRRARVVGSRRALINVSPIVAAPRRAVPMHAVASLNLNPGRRQSDRVGPTRHWRH